MVKEIKCMDGLNNVKNEIRNSLSPTDTDFTILSANFKVTHYGAVNLTQSVNDDFESAEGTYGRYVFNDLRYVINASELMSFSYNHGEGFTVRLDLSKLTNHDKAFEEMEVLFLLNRFTMLFKAFYFIDLQLDSLETADERSDKGLKVTTYTSNFFSIRDLHLLLENLMRDFSLINEINEFDGMHIDEIGNVGNL